MLLIAGVSDNIFSSGGKTFSYLDDPFQEDRAISLAVNSGAISGKVDDSMFRAANMRASREMNRMNAAGYLNARSFYQLRKLLSTNLRLSPIIVTSRRAAEIVR